MPLSLLLYGFILVMNKIGFVFLAVLGIIGAITIVHIKPNGNAYYYLLQDIDEDEEDEGTSERLDLRTF